MRNFNLFIIMGCIKFALQAYTPQQGVSMCSDYGCTPPTLPAAVIPKKGPTKPPPIAKPKASTQGNLPNYYTPSRFTDTGYQQDFHLNFMTLFDPLPKDIEMKELLRQHIGQMFESMLSQALVISPNTPTPVSVKILDGALKRSTAIGVASLDQDLKKVLITFHTLRWHATKKLYCIKATGHAMNGALGLTGKTVSHAAKYFLGELGAAMSGALVDASIQRTPTLLGGVYQEPSLSNAVKTASATTLYKSADRFAQQVAGETPYTTVEGYQLLKVFIQEIL